MEKIIYAVWKQDGESRAALNDRLQGAVASDLLAIDNVRGLRINVQDDAVAPAEPLRQVGTDPQMDAVVQVWVNVNHGAYREPVDAVLRAASGRIGAWLVLESAVIPNTTHRPDAGARTYGFSQVCFIQKPARLTHEEWRHNWQMLHTPVGRDTQSNFEYIQNLIVRPLIEGPQPYACIVEECFPPEAMTSAEAFFDAVGDPARFERNTRLMAESCARFIDMGAAGSGVDVLLTSQFDVQAPTFA